MLFEDATFQSLAKVSTKLIPCQLTLERTKCSTEHSFYIIFSCKYWTVSKGLQKFASTILKMKTLIHKGNIELLRLEISSCRAEDSRHCKCSLVSLGLYHFGQFWCVCVCLSLSLSVSLSIYLSIDLSIYLSISI